MYKNMYCLTTILEPYSTKKGNNSRVQYCLAPLVIFSVALHVKLTDDSHEITRLLKHFFAPPLSHMQKIFFCMWLKGRAKKSTNV